MRISLGYPPVALERELLAGVDRREMIAGLTPALAAAELATLQGAVRTVHLSEALLDYVQALIGATRSDRRYAPGLSPRAGQGIVRAARAWAFLHGRSAVLPEDVQAVFVAVAAHRLQTADGAADPLDVGRRILGTVPIG